MPACLLMDAVMQGPGAFLTLEPGYQRLLGWCSEQQLRLSLDPCLPIRDSLTLPGSPPDPFPSNRDSSFHGAATREGGLTPGEVHAHVSESM